MYRKDYILRIIEEFAKMVGVILGLKLEGNFKEAEEVIDEALKKFTETDIAYLLSLKQEDFLPELIEKRKLSEEQLHVIAELLYQNAEIKKIKGKPEETPQLYLYSWYLFNWLSENQRKTFSTEIAQKCALLKQLSGQ